MQKSNIYKIFLAIFLCVPTVVYCNVIWPGMIIAGGILNTTYLPYLIIISVAAEACCFYWFLKNITWQRAFWMSCIGNAASTLVGTLVMALFMLVWDFAFDTFLSGMPNLINTIATIVIMFLGSCFIEFLAIKYFFGYSFKQLWLPILIGNAVTYGLIIVFNLNEVKHMLGYTI